MQIYNGKSVFGGIAIGKISVYQKKEQQVKRVKIDDPEQEMARYEKAKAEGIKQLQGLYDKALREVGEANAAIFEVHQMMMEDDGYNESVENIIRSQGVNAEYAVATTGDNYAQMFSAMDDDYMRERAAEDGRTAACRTYRKAGQDRCRCNEYSFQTGGCKNGSACRPCGNGRGRP